MLKETTVRINGKQVIISDVNLILTWLINHLTLYEALNNIKTMIVVEFAIFEKKTPLKLILHEET